MSFNDGKPVYKCEGCLLLKRCACSGHVRSHRQDGCGLAARNGNHRNLELTPRPDQPPIAGLTIPCQGDQSELLEVGSVVSWAQISRPLYQCR
jgi:hypothetical protein